MGHKEYISPTKVANFILLLLRLVHITTARNGYQEQFPLRTKLSSTWWAFVKLFLYLNNNGFRLKGGYHTYI